MFMLLYTFHFTWRDILMRICRRSFRKILATFFAVVFVLLSIPTAFAATQIALSASMVTEWPTATGELYYGQTVGEAITLSGGKVVYNGVEIPGKFVHYMDSFRPLQASEASKANLKFVPDDETAYKGFNKLMSSTTYVVKKTLPVLKDENNPPVATSVKSGQLLSESIISGGVMVNPYNATETSIQSAIWCWTNPETELTESGKYEAYLQGKETCYEKVTTKIYVEVEQDTFTTEVATLPAIDELTYDPNQKWDDVILHGGTVVVKGTDTPVEGNFKIADNWVNYVPTVGSYEIDINFVPDDTTKYVGVSAKLPVTVNKAVPSFKTDDESGIPTITMPYGTKLDSSLDYKIKPLIDVGVPVSLAYKDLDGNNLSYSGTTPVVGTHEIQVRVNIDNTNYEQFTMLTFNLEITGFESSCIVVPVGSEGYKIVDEGIAYNVSKPTGTFTVSYTINGEKQPDITVKYGELFQIEKVKSGDYVFTVTYNEIENDPFSVVVKTFEIKEKLGRNVKIGDSTQKYTYGDTVTVTAPATDPAKPDKPYYGFTGWEVKGNIGLSDEDLANAEISFAMPDEDVELNATYEFSLKLFFEWIWQQIVQFFTFIINAMKDLFALAVA